MNYASYGDDGNLALIRSFGHLLPGGEKGQFGLVS